MNVLCTVGHEFLPGTQRACLRMDERARAGRFLTSAGADGLCGRSLQVRTAASLLASSSQHSLGEPRGAERNRALPSDASRSREEPSGAERHFPEPSGASPPERNRAPAAESSPFPQFPASAPSCGPLNPFPRRRNPTRACAAPSRPRPRAARPRPQAVLESRPCGARAAVRPLPLAAPPARRGARGSASGRRAPALGGDGCEWRRRRLRCTARTVDAPLGPGQAFGEPGRGRAGPAASGGPRR